MNLFEKGWICPRCEAVMSPTTKCCVNCRGKTQTQLANQETTAYFTAEQVRKMAPLEVKENYSAILKSMEKWGADDDKQ